MKVRNVVVCLDVSPRNRRTLFFSEPTQVESASFQSSINSFRQRLSLVS
jgi:hypothetical protein